MLGLAPWEDPLWRVHARHRQGGGVMIWLSDPSRTAVRQLLLTTTMALTKMVSLGSWPRHP